jgi:hypothetical protein
MATGSPNLRAESADLAENAMPDYAPVNRRRQRRRIHRS